ncbi:DUF5107 domain-containing protein [Aestuariibaculum suncheonense]|uniref:DUF5107 domain-containing protein n=1 Tax=Aestuariibaculum suncheonense TaxID=1028745 RepID=A0A8J6QH93_9FLAO|nr:DUF5107 domain-containing protein [Aestuariibaculum suncheonense]MBD0835401.1 DUF5107 domain-containing protein [Aestuariibaculum suncheonense]
MIGLLKYKIFGFVLFIVSVPGSLVAQNNSTVTETTKKYVTYPFSDPNPIPSEGKIYPYFRYDGFTEKAEKKDWKIVELENDYIKVQIMPEIGGKIWSALDKRSGQNFLYNNEVVKFRDIALRGPWVSGGIEFNYGIIGHTPNTATPVDYLTKENSDGSVSCYISTFDLLTRTNWVLEIKLEKDKSYFSTSSYWFNSNSTEQPYYTWMNAGIPANDDLEFLYPGNKYLGHEGETFNWPNDSKDRNLALYSENAFGGSKSFHVFGVHSDYFGGYWEDNDHGMIHYAKRGAKLGKKIFLWAQSDEGKIWEDLLTDDSGQYVEIQSGRLFNQNTFESSSTPFKQIGFVPYTTDEWTEYWFPFNGIKGFTSANLLGAFNIKYDNKLLSIKLSPVKSISDTLTVFSDKGKKLANVFVKANPVEVYEEQILINSEDNPAYIILEGQRIAVNQDRKERELSRPLEVPNEFDSESAYGLFLQGRDLYRFRNYKLSEEKILASLSKDPLFIPSLVEMTKIKLFKLEIDSAYIYAKKALSIDTYHPEANYYYGLAALKKNKMYDALDGFEVASLSIPYRGAAYTALSRTYLKSGDYYQAKENAELSLKSNPRNLESLKILYMISRINKDDQSLKLLRENIEKLNPIDHFVRFENYFSNSNEIQKDIFQSLIRNELPVETYLELAIWYAGLNRYEESKRILQMAPQNSIVLYWLAWLHSNDGNREASNQYLEKAHATSVDFVFPFREETFKVLEWASAQKKSWKSDYLLALINEFKGNEQEAYSLLASYDNIEFAPFYVMKARLEKSATIHERLTSMQKAVELKPEEWRYGRLLAAGYLEIGQFDKAIQILEKYYKINKENYYVGLDLIEALIKAERYKDSEKILSNITVLPFEGANEARQYYRQTKLMLAYQAIENEHYDNALKKIEEAEEWPLNLGVGKPYSEMINNNLENALRVKIFYETGDVELHEKYLKIVEDQIIEYGTLYEKIKSLLKKDKRLF